MSSPEGAGASRSRAASAPAGQDEAPTTTAFPPGADASPSAPNPAAAPHDTLPPALLAWAATAPVALAALAPDDTIAWVNAAFERLSGFAAARIVGRDAAGLLAPSPPAGSPARRRLLRADGASVACDAQCDPVGPGRRLLTLVARDVEETQAATIARLGERLDFVQTQACIGTWERDLRTQEGRWDDHMFRFFGLDPQHGTPSIAQVAQASVPQDRLFKALNDSLRTPGLYQHRFRLPTPQGGLRRIQARWQVFGAAQDGQAGAGTPERVVGLLIDNTETFAIASSIDDDAAQLQLATELADVSMWRHDLATQRVHFNEQALDVLGMQPHPDGTPIDEVRGRIHPDDLPEVIATYQRALTSRRPEDSQARYRHPDGGWRDVFTRRIALRDGFGTPIVLSGVALDISAQVERMRRSDELARQLDEVTAASGIGVWRLRRDGDVAEWNAQMHVLSGLPPDQPPLSFDAWVDTCVHADDRERVRRTVAGWPGRDGTPAELAHRIARPDGQVRHVVVRGRADPANSPYLLTGVTIDVTERERALAALREATERSAMAAHAAGLGIWDWDLDTGVARWEEQMFVLRGIVPRDTCPTFEEMAAWVHPDDRQAVSEQFNGAHAEDRSAYYEFRIVRPDGAVRWLASRSLPVRDEQGRTRSRLGVNWDVTEAHESAAARQERALVLRESQAKSELLARMSHELRTPMNAVLGFTQLLLAEEDALPARSGHDAEPGETDGSSAAGIGTSTSTGTGTRMGIGIGPPADAGANARRRARLEHIRDAGEHLLTLIDDVLELSRLDGPERDVVLQPVALAPLVAQTLPLLERLAREHAVTVVAPASPLHVRADATRLKQVLVNLLSNAIKYNRPGGSVQLDVSGDTDRVRMRVIDDGIGMTPRQQELAFEPFNRAGAERERVEGTGIGLTIVKALVERMGGRIGVHSTPGVGSVFEVSLEAAAAPHALAAPVRRLLYIEDNPVNVLIVSELVRRRGGVEFDSTPDGLSGVARATQTLPDLVLVDMQLPDIDGLEVLARLRADPRTAGLRVIALSANAIAADIRRALEAGFDDYWTKPLDFAVFDAALDRVLDHAGQPMVPSA